MNENLVKIKHKYLYQQYNLPTQKLVFLFLNRTIILLFLKKLRFQIKNEAQNGSEKKHLDGTKMLSYPSKKRCFKGVDAKQAFIKFTILFPRPEKLQLWQ